MYYKYILNGDFYGKYMVKGTYPESQEDYNFSIDVEIPINYATKEEAEKCDCSLRFEKRNGHIVLCIYSGWEQGVNKEGKWFEHVSGKVIDTIRWREHWKYKTTRSIVPAPILGHNIDDCDWLSEEFKKEAREILKGAFIDSNSDYLPDATDWDELFQANDKPEGWSCTVEVLAYRIVAYDD